MKPTTFLLVFGAIGLLFLGCMGMGEPSAEEQNKERIQELEDKLNTSMEKISENMDSADIAMDRGDYEEVRSILTETKADLRTMDEDAKELCELTDNNNTDFCGPEGSVIASCLIPMLDIIMDITSLTEGIQDECTSSGCPAWVISHCENIAADAEAIRSECEDTRIDPDEISELCEKMSEVGASD